ncbi:nucleotide sugar dehydrogenase [Pelobium manganitolerans]|uniref:nucleotide sugar dehydrogenase n=1 Tax=Pelobium manganitolerans TaxID=1842495 RepID=UPI003FA3987B
MSIQEKKIAIVGLGYVGLPLAVEFASQFDVVGFDVNPKRIAELKNYQDHTLEISSQQLADAKRLTFTSDATALKNCNIFIVTVPTPVDAYRNPDINLLKKASKMVGEVLKKGDIVIYESTVYPGCTEEDCVPVLEQFSGLVYNQDFFCGYSPERINPGDKEHTVTKILKITSGSTPETAKEINELYSTIIRAGTHQASSIKVAEAAKVIENAQRDINIAFVNELALIFNRLGIDTHEVLEAAGTKWNFLKFKPGLVGGHCIGVDPYYLAQKAKSVDYNPEILLAGRRINDGMSDFIADEVIKGLIDADVKIKGSKVLVLGITFKENCPDVRNTKVVDIIFKLQRFGLDVMVLDPWADALQVEKEYSIALSNVSEIQNIKFEAIIHAVAHSEFRDFNFAKHSGKTSFIYDVKGTLPKKTISKRL